MLPRPALLAVCLLVGLPLLAGCGAIFGQRYANFTAYYNTFYNAQRDFERAERAILRADDAVDRTRFLSLFPRAETPPGRGGGGQQGFESAIQRAADVLRDHPGSKWVEDALLLIGKSYFYQGNFDAAAQKFREVLTLDGGRHIDEAYLWLGRSLMEAHNYGDAAAVLRQGLDREELASRWTPAMRLAMAENELRRGDLEAAASGLYTGLEQLDDAELGARGHFLLGQVLDSLGEFDRAAEAYARALALRPRPELTYAAELQRALALSRGGRVGDALTRLERLRRDDRYFQQRAEVELLRARALVAAGEPDAAKDLLVRLLYHPESGLRIDRVRGQLHYRLAEIYRDELNDRMLAAAHFDTAATALPRPAVGARDVQNTPEAILDARRLAESFGSYALVYGRIAEMDSLLYLGGLSDDDFAEAIERIADERRQEALAAERERRRLEDQQGFGQGPGTAGTPVEGDVAGPGGDGGQDAGFLSFRNPVRVQENLIAFQSRWGDRPHLPDWRRRAAVTAAIAGGEDYDEEQLEALAQASQTPLDAIVDVSAVPRAPEAYLQMRTERAVARYELGNVLFLTLAEPRAAADWYGRVLDEDADLPVALRARFALAEVYASLGEQERSEALLLELSQQSEEDPLVRAALERLGKPAPPPPADSLELARRAYEAAFQLWEDRDHREALRAMLEVDSVFPRSEMAGRARLAAGMIYMQWAAPDTLTLLAAGPQALLAPDDSLAQPEHLVLGAAAHEEFVAESFSDGSESSASEERDPPHEGAGGPPAEPGSSSGIPEAAEEGTMDDEPSSTASEEVPVEVPGDDGTILPLELLAQAGSVAADTSALEGDPNASGEEAPLDAEPGVEAQEPPRSWLETLYASIEEDFPGTPFAERAARFRLVLEDQRAALAAPQHEMSEGDLDTEHLPEGLPEDQEPQPLELDADHVPGNVAQSSLMGEEALSAQAGGYSWAVLRTPREVEAHNRLVAFHNRGYRTALLIDVVDEIETFLVLIGQFATEDDALAARHALPIGTDPAHLEVIRLVPELHLRTAEDLLAR